MRKPRFIAGEHFDWYGRKLEVIRGLPTDEIIVRDTKTAKIIAVDFIELVMQFVLQQLDLVIDKREDMNGHSEEGMEIAHFRKEILDTVLKIPVRKRRVEIQKLVDEIRSRPLTDDDRPPLVSVASIYRWLEIYEKSNYDVGSLVPNTKQRGGKGKSRLPNEVEHIVWQVIEESSYASGNSASFEEVTRRVNARIDAENQRRGHGEKLPTISRATVIRRMQTIERNSTSS